MRMRIVFKREREQERAGKIAIEVKGGKTLLFCMCAVPYVLVIPNESVYALICVCVCRGPSLPIDHYGITEFVSLFAAVVNV